MKEKTSVTLSPEALHGIDELAGAKRSRSAVLDEIVLRYMRERKKAQRRARDIAILNRYADELNRNAEDGLDEQAPEED
jgi:metal-responsive CopG/Arc/MetJ family transcriptional regulator